jgi:hypothetical protein
LAAVEAELAGGPQIDAASYESGAAMLAAGGEGGAALDVHELAEPGVHRADYEPEFERYGGAGQIDVSERLFCLSSRLVLAVLVRDLPREAFALEALAAVGAALGTPIRRERFARGSRDSWLQWSRRAIADGDGRPIDLVGLLANARALVERIERVDVADRILDTKNPPIRRWCEALAAAATRWPMPESILASHAHMLLNRLGLGPPQELLLHTALAELLCRRRTGYALPLPTSDPYPPAGREPSLEELAARIASRLSARAGERNDLHLLKAGGREAMLLRGSGSRDVRPVAGDALGAALEPAGAVPAQGWAVLSGPSNAPVSDPWAGGISRPRRASVRDPELAALALGLDGLDRVVHDVWTVP